ncbi:hypothetical protein GH733_017204 [Mirounga leonina]|nr:hypothetical protein GH733_017204 [Mirounga leonina]
MSYSPLDMYQTWSPLSPRLQDFNSHPDAWQLHPADLRSRCSDKESDEPTRKQAGLKQPEENLQHNYYEVGVFHLGKKSCILDSPVYGCPH